MLTVARKRIRNKIIVPFRREATIRLRGLDYANCMRPSFLIVGAMKAGTTSLYRYLAQHPLMLPPVRKEIKYFDQKFEKGLGWYLSHFPHKYKIPKPNNGRGDYFTGEASPSYLFVPGAADRIKSALPNVNVIALLRNPAERAYSHFMHNVRMGREDLSFREALEQEGDRVRHDADMYRKNMAYVGYNLIHYSYRKRGLYYDQVIRLEQTFGKERVLILNSADLFTDAEKTLNSVTRFLGVEPFKLKHSRVYNKGEYKKNRSELLSCLREYYRDHNQTLYAHLGMDLSW